MQFLNVLTDKYGLDRIQVEAINMGLDHAPDWKIILRHRLLDSSYAVNVRCGLKQAKSLAAMYYRSIFEEQFSMYLASIPQRYFPPVKSASLSKLRYPMGVDLEWDSSDLKKGFLITFCDGARYSIVKCPKCKIPPRARGILLSPQKKYFATRRCSLGAPCRVVVVFFKRFFVVATSIEIRVEVGRYS